MLTSTLRFLAPTGAVLLAFLAANLVSRARDAGPREPRTSAGAEALDAQGLAETRLPSPGLTPDEVVEIQLAGLADHERPAVGILQCYCFASPLNALANGPLERFGQIVRAPPFDVMATARARLVGKPVVQGRTARVLASIVDDQGRISSFVFWLRRQEGDEYRDCWMTDAVLPVNVPPRREDPQRRTST
ncbi:MAG: hypothetical protein KF847_10335 [Pirellulales bacterium]|nr:hypothetical protein [Pirellulales bacterium]